jgi:hypothetical protein
MGCMGLAIPARWVSSAYLPSTGQAPDWAYGVWCMVCVWMVYGVRCGVWMVCGWCVGGVVCGVVCGWCVDGVWCVYGVCMVYGVVYGVHVVCGWCVDGVWMGRGEGGKGREGAYVRINRRQKTSRTTYY